MKITISYKCDELDPPQRATCRIRLVNNTANVKWEFNPDISDKTSDPLGLIVALMNTVHESLGIKAENQ
jgi:hypothetical protein